MSRDINLLESDFRRDALNLLVACRTLGIEMRPFYTIRDPYKQARLWRQSRPFSEIERRADELKQSGADFLADVILSVGPQNGHHVTNAIPGLSWHQWGEALDCFWLVDGDAEWSTRRKVVADDGRGINGYKLYGEEARNFRLTSGGFWSRLKDWPHVQKRPRGVLSYYSLAEVEEEMKRRFPND